MNKQRHNKQKKKKIWIDGEHRVQYRLGISGCEVGNVSYIISSPWEDAKENPWTPVSFSACFITKSCKPGAARAPRRAAGITPLLYRCEDRALESEPTPVSAAGRDRTQSSGPLLFTDVWTVQLAMKQACDFPYSRGRREPKALKH